MDAEINWVEKYCSVVRAIVHTQTSKTSSVTKNAVILETQLNGGNVSPEVDFCKNLFGNQVAISTVFAENELIDTIAVTKGMAARGVVKRWEAMRSLRKTHRGFRKAARIAAWHPARMQFQVSRYGQYAYRYRIEVNKKTHRIATSSDPK